MLYLSQIVGNPVLDASGERIGSVNDLGIATGEVFPRVTSLAFQGPGKEPFMISWRKYVETFNEKEIRLKVNACDIRFSYLQPEEVLIARDLLNKQIVDTQGMHVVRVNDLKLSDTSQNQLRLIGAEVGTRGILRSLSPHLEKACLSVAHLFGKDIPERIIAWNYMDLLDRNLSDVKLSISHKTLDELHPADIADIIEQLDPHLRGQVFAQLDDEQAAEAIAELDDSQAAKLVNDMQEKEASKMLSAMDPDDAAELVSELNYDKAEKLIRLMGVKEQTAVRQLLGYKDDTAGRIMTSEFVSVEKNLTVCDTIAHIKALDEQDFETFDYIYVVDENNTLVGITSLKDLIIAEHDEKLANIMEQQIISASPDDDQEDVAETISKYNLLALPVIDEQKHILGIVTVDDALDVLEEEHEEDLQLAGGPHTGTNGNESQHQIKWYLQRMSWVLLWIFAAALCIGLLHAHISHTLLYAALAVMPFVLLNADNMVRSSINFHLEYDVDDPDSPSTMGFVVKNIFIVAIFNLIVILCVTGLLSCIFPEPNAVLTRVIIGAFVVNACTNVISYLSCPVFLRLLQKREDANQETFGFSLHVAAMICACMVFMALLLACVAIF